jgi:hypothetical protein
MKRSIGVILGALAAAVTLAACNNGNNSSNIPPGGGTNCGNPPYNMEVLYPKPNTGKAPPNVGGVVVAFSKALPANNQYDLWVNQSDGKAQFTSNASGGPVYGPGSGFTTIAYSKIPLPHANATFPNPQYYVTLFNSPIGPAQAVNLYWNDAALACTPNVIVSSFSTK